MSDPAPAMPEILKQVLQEEGLGTPYLGAYGLPSRNPEFGEFPRASPAKLREALGRLGIETLFTHQAAAYEAVMDGKDVCVVTRTNSGKSLCYMLPAYDLLLGEPAARVMALYPTKALAQDQLDRFEALRPWPEFRIGVYDGDTPRAQRGPMRKLAHVMLTNPDMLHIGILPGHEMWGKFFKSLRLIVLDEMHVYRGVFGSHVAGILRRLLRIAAWYGSKPRIVGCTATIGNPGELFESLTGRRPEVIDADGSGQPAKTFAFWNPAAAVTDATPSPNWMSARLLVRLAAEGKQTLVFCRSRVAVELVLRYARELAEKSGRPRPEQLDSYRAGYTAGERRKLEKAIHQGKLLGLVTTNAMELGVDIGVLDAVVLNGYPGSIAGFRQQCGRAGRGSRPGLAIFVAHEDPLEQYFTRDPESLILGHSERVSVNLGNPSILEPQLQCAAHERPLDPSELEGFGARGLEVVEGMDRAGTLVFQRGRFYYPLHEPPAAKVDIRGAGGDLVTLMDGIDPLGTMERWRALQYAHAGAVYLHRGTSYLVESLDLQAELARVVPFDGPYYTQPIVQSLVEPLVTLDTVQYGELAMELGSVRVTDMVLGYRKRALDGGQVIETHDLDLPPTSFETVGVRVDLPAFEAEEDLPIVAPGVHALEHALISVAPLIAGCDRNDLGSGWFGIFPHTMAPAVYIFDRFAGGMGLSEKLFDAREDLFSTALRALEGCACSFGCPKCLYLARCDIANDALDKSAALQWLRVLAGADSPNRKETG